MIKKSKKLKPLTPEEKIICWMVIYFIMIILIMSVGFNIIIKSHFGIYYQIGPPYYDDPSSC